jgi:hypothetical protein
MEKSEVPIYYFIFISNSDEDNKIAVFTVWGKSW